MAGYNGESSIPHNIKVTRRVLDYINSYGGRSVARAINDSIHLLMKMEGQALEEIRGVLTSNEWIFLAYLLQLSDCPPELMADKEELARIISEPKNLIMLADKYGIQPYELMDKINRFNSLQVFAVNRRIQSFWASQGTFPNSDDFKNWANY